MSKKLLMLLLLANATTLLPECVARDFAVTAPRAAPYHQPVTVTVTIPENSDLVSAVIIHYAILSNGTASDGWRVSRALPNPSVAKSGYAIFQGVVPNKLYGEAVGYGAAIVLHVEVRRESGRVEFSAPEASRWSPGMTEGKNIVVLSEDRIPPAIKDIRLMPVNPVALTPRTVEANVTDGLGSGVAAVHLFYSPDTGVTWNRLEMQAMSRQRFAASIPPLVEGAFVIVYVESTDRAGNMARTEPLWYTVQRNPNLFPFNLIAEARRLLPQIAVVGIGLALLGSIPIGLKLIRRLKEVKVRPEPRATARGLITVLFLGFAASVMGSVSYYLYASRLGWLSVLVLATFFEFIPILHPGSQAFLFSLFPRLKRVGFIRTVGKLFRDNPPSILMAACYSLLLPSLIIMVLSLGGRLEMAVGMQTLNSIALYLILLLSGAIIGQLGWILFRGAKEP